MKKVIFSIGTLLLGAIGFAQSVCFNSFEVLNNGNGQGNGCPSATFPGYLSQPPSPAHARSGKVELRFSAPLPIGINPPEITKIRKILSTGPTTYGPYLDFKFSFLQFIGVGRTVTEYCYYADGDLANGAGASYEAEVKYDASGSNETSTCVIIYAADPIPLPVHFKSFNANRTTSSSVSISWTTAMEQNNKGFNVQKNVGGEWKTIAFVFSQTADGNSSSDLTYSYKDANNEKGITQYRIQQVDLDGNAKYSDIRAIRGEGTAAKIVVYPNPSADGKLNLVFEGNSEIRDVQVADMQGRVVKAYNGITNNVLVIERLSSGFYLIKISNRNTTAISVEKVVVK